MTDDKPIWGLFTALWMIQRAGESSSLSLVARRCRGGLDGDLAIRWAMAQGCLRWLQGDAVRWMPSFVGSADGKPITHV